MTCWWLGEAKDGSVNGCRTVKVAGYNRRRDNGRGLPSARDLGGDDASTMVALARYHLRYTFSARHFLRVVCVHLRCPPRYVFWGSELHCTCVRLLPRTANVRAVSSITDQHRPCKAA